MRETPSQAFVTCAPRVVHPRTTKLPQNRCVKPSKTWPIAQVVRQIRPASMRKILPVLATMEQTRLHMGDSSAILDRVFLAIILVIVLHLLPGTRILTLLKVLTIGWPILQPFLRASARNARIRKGAAYVVHGQVFVVKERGKDVLFVDGVKSGMTVKQSVEGIGYGLVIGGRLRAVWCERLLCEYPYITNHRMRRLVEMFRSDC